MFTLDKLGMCTSAVCAVHCLATPFIILLFPLSGLAIIDSEGVEVGLLVLSFLFAVSSLVVSYFRRHRNIQPVLIASIGFFLFILGKSFSSEVLEIVFSVLGGTLLVTAHYFNIKLTKKMVVVKSALK